MTYEVHWEEGLFLRPQHFQMLQRTMSLRLGAERSWSWPFPYGLVRADLAREELANGWFEFRRLTVVTRQGVLVDFPGGAELARLNIGQKLEEFGSAGVVVHLAVPLYDPNRANVAEQSQADEFRHWRIDELEDVPDENHGSGGYHGQPATPIRIRRINARLIAAPDGREPSASGMETMALARVERVGSGEDVGLPRLDEQFVPACLVIGGSALLRQLIVALANQIESAWRQAAGSVVPAGGSVDTLRGAQMTRLMRAQTLGRHAAYLLPWVKSSGAVSPFEVYLRLRSLAADLGVVAGRADPLEAVAEYDHDDPYTSFASLDRALRGLLATSDERRGWDRVAFVEEEGQTIAHLTPAHLAGGVQYYLGIRSPEEPRTLASKVEDANAFRLLASSMRRGGRVFGVVLRKTWDPPSQFPGGADRHYFELLVDESARVWERVKSDGGLMIDSGLVEDGQLRASDLAVFMTLAE